MADDQKSLIEEAGEDYLAGRSVPKPQVAAARDRLNKALLDFSSGRDHGAEAFGRYCATVSKIAALAGLSERARWGMVGRYVEAAVSVKRKTGRPSSNLESMFVFAWDEINAEREKAGRPLLDGNVPGKEIAAWCTRFGVRVTANQVCDQLRKGKRAFQPRHKNTGLNTGD